MHKMLNENGQIKICFIIGQLVKHGAERQLYELLCGLDKKRFSPVVISLSEGGYWADEIRKLGIQLFELERRKNKEFTRLFRLIKIIQRIRPHLIHTSAYAANYYGRIAGILTGTKIIISSERSIVDAGNTKRRREIVLDKILYYFTAGIICNSRYAWNGLVKNFKFREEKVFTIYNGLNFDDYRLKKKEHSPAQNKKMHVGTVGRIYAVKNHKLFLDVARIILEKKGPENVDFHIVGDGPQGDEVRSYAERLGIIGSVIFHGEKNNVPEILRDFDVFVITSDYEGFSNAIMEAMITGVPVVATAVGGNDELVLDGNTGYLCPPRSADKMASQILKILDDPDMGKKLGEEGRKRILEEFSTAEMVRKTERVFDILIQRTYGTSRENRQIIHLEKQQENITG